MTQKRALEIMLKGRNIFLTGPPGSGKTFLLRRFIEESEKMGKNVAVTATTGIAATHISGQTINSWAGIGQGKRLKGVNSESLKKRIASTDVLLIDEISIMNSRTLDLLDIICKINRQSMKTFGGLQVILVGDFFQLPPVTKAEEPLKYAFRASSWSDLELSICYLDEQFRQNKADPLLKILLSIRNGAFSEVEQKIVSKRIQKLPIYNRVIKLLSHNYDAEQINKKELAKLAGKVRVYLSVKHGSSDELRLLQSQTLAPEKLELKVSSEVMFVVNNPGSGYVNGSRGIVKELFAEQVVVKVYGGTYVKLRRHKFTLDAEVYKGAYIYQFPIKLAWGLTIHKSQGMTLDKAIIDLSHAFLPNMGYVAISRVRSFDGLYLSALNKMAFAVNNEIREVDEEFKRLSDKLSD